MGQGRNPGESSLVICGLSSVNCACPKLMGLGGKGKDNGLACFLLKCAPSSDSLFAGTIEWWLFLARKFISQCWISGTKASRLWILSVVRSPLQHLWALVSVCFSLEPFWISKVWRMILRHDLLYLLHCKGLPSMLLSVQYYISFYLIFTWRVVAKLGKRVYLWVLYSTQVWNLQVNTTYSLIHACLQNYCFGHVEFLQKLGYLMRLSHKSMKNPLLMLAGCNAI